MVFNIQEGTFKMINLFLTILPILNPENTRKSNKTLLVFSRGKKWEHWPDMGEAICS